MRGGFNHVLVTGDRACKSIALLSFLLLGCQNGAVLIGRLLPCFGSDAVPDGCEAVESKTRLCLVAPLGTTECVDAPAFDVTCNGEVVDTFLDCTVFVGSPADVPPIGDGASP